MKWPYFWNHNYTWGQISYKSQTYMCSDHWISHIQKYHNDEWCWRSSITSWFNQTSRFGHRGDAKFVWIQFGGWATYDGVRSEPDWSKVERQRSPSPSLDETGGLIGSCTRLMFSIISQFNALCNIVGSPTFNLWTLLKQESGKSAHTIRHRYVKTGYIHGHGYFLINMANK